MSDSSQQRTVDTSTDIDIQASRAEESARRDLLDFCLRLVSAVAALHESDTVRDLPVPPIRLDKRPRA